MPSPGSTRRGRGTRGSGDGGLFGLWRFRWEAAPESTAYPSTQNSLNGFVRCHVVLAPSGSEKRSPSLTSIVGPPSMSAPLTKDFADTPLAGLRDALMAL